MSTPENELAPDIALEVAAAVAVIEPATPGTELGIEPGTATEPPVEKPVPEPAAEGSKPRPYIPATGHQISVFMSAADNGMSNLYEATEAEVEAFVKGVK